MLLLFFLIPTFLSARMNPQLEDFLRTASRQTEQWKGTQTLRETREYQVGDTQTFWSWNLSVMPPAWIQTPATCRAVGEFCYVFVADNQWNINMNQDDVDIVFNYLENETMNSTDYGAVEMDINLFGPVPDEIDNDPKVIVFYMALGSFNGTAFDGYFSAYNQVTEQQAQQMNPPGHSNECEMIYMTCSPLNPTDPIRISVLSHELEHMIHWGQDINEETWLDEGCAELAMVHFGIPDPIVNFPNNPDNSLHIWNQLFADYVKVMLYFTYLDEQFSTGENEFIKDIVSDPINGLASISNQLAGNGYTIPLEAVFHNWAIANFIDDPALEQGQYGYQRLELPNFTVSASHLNFPVSAAGAVQPWATDYIRVYPNGMNIEHSITVNNTNQNIGILKKHLDEDLFDVEFINFSGSWTGYIPPEWDDLYHYIIYVYANPSFSALNYSYTLDEIVSAENVIPDLDVSVNCYPNPFFLSGSARSQTAILFDIVFGNYEISELVIYNIKGQKVRSFDLFSDAPNSNLSVSWNLQNEQGKNMGAGVYFYQLRSHDKTLFTDKLSILK
jgi:hypothetical protein